jgi:dihydrodipicolinate synthase/N-acetylneuraminate lyase
MAGHWRGVFTIPSTPFDDRGVVDVESLRREVDFCVAAGAHGLVSPVNASEFTTLTDAERMLVMRTVVEQNAGRLPTVLGVAGSCDEHAVMLAKYAESIGADAVIAMPPYVRPVGLPDIYQYYRALSSAVGIPIFIQNADAPAGTRLTAEFCANLVNELEHVDYVKEETAPSLHAISAELELCDPKKLKGIMGGIGGRPLLLEYERGICGTMPACDTTDVLSDVWNLLDAGKEVEARDLFNRLLPLLNYQFLIPGVYKAILKRRGVIKTDYLRATHGNQLNQRDQQDLTALLAEIGDLFRIYPPA